jgi:multicomponent K+:H+ antiporter subunit E
MSNHQAFGAMRDDDGNRHSPDHTRGRGDDGHGHGGSQHPRRRKDDQLTYLERWLPHPLLTTVLVLLWLALVNSTTTGDLVIGLFWGMIIPIYTANFWPQRPAIRKPLLAVAFIAIVMFDVVVANVQVAYLILFRRPEQLRSRWIAIPLDLTSPEAITVLTGTITLTPGTVASDLSADGRTLLVHCLDVGSEKEMVRQIKDRYERRIKAIFP